MRATANDVGTVLATANYDPYGGVQGTALGSFGFTGELQQNANVYLRARWYDAGRGRFVGRDPFAGWGETPYSLHPYQYGYSNPIIHRDPSGRCNPTGDDWECSPPRDPVQEMLVEAQRRAQPILDGIVECANQAQAALDALPPIDIALIEGLELEIDAGLGNYGITIELVTDVYSFKQGLFITSSLGGNLDANTDLPFSAQAYIGLVTGLRDPRYNYDLRKYAGLGTSADGNLGWATIGAGISDVDVESPPLRTYTIGVGASKVPIKGPLEAFIPKWARPFVGGLPDFTRDYTAEPLYIQAFSPAGQIPTAKAGEAFAAFLSARSASQTFYTTLAGMATYNVEYWRRQARQRKE